MLKLIALIVPQGLDTFAASTALGAAGVAGRERVRVGLLFGALSLGVLRLAVVPVAVAVGLQALVVALVGTAVGTGLSERARERSERLAGVALVVLAAALVLARALG